MRLKNRPLAIAGFSVFAVLLLSVFVSGSISVISTVCGALLFALTVFIKPLRDKIFPFYLSAALILGGMLYVLHKDYKLDYVYSLITDEKSVIEGHIKDYPEYEDSTYRYHVEVEKINGNDVDSDMLLSLPYELDAEPYDRIKGSVKLYILGKSAGSDVWLYYQSKGILLGGYSDADDEISVESENDKSIKYGIAKLRHSIELNILNRLPNEYGGTVIALLVGDKSFISDGLNNKLRLAGIAPVFAVSGMHLSVWIMGLYSLLEQLKIRKRINITISLVFLLFFAAITGFVPSVCRSGLMMLILMSGRFFYRRSDSLNSLGFATLVLCIINPYIVADIGFLMSFFATLGIITLYPLAAEHLKRIKPTVIRAVISPVLVSLFAVLGSLPVTVLFIGYISVYTLLTNLLVIYSASICMVMGGLTALLSSLNAVSEITAAVAGATAKYIISVVEFINKLPAVAFSTDNIFWKCAVLASLILICFAFIFLKVRTAKQFLACSLSVVIISSSLSSYFYHKDLTSLSVLDVGSGIAVVITKGDRKILLNGGSESYGAQYTIEDELNRISRKQTDMLLIPDESSSHSSTTLSVLKKLDFGKVIMPAESQDVMSLASGKVVIKPQVNVKLWNGGMLNFYSRDDSSFCICELDGVKFFIIFSSNKKSTYDEAFKNCDYLICCKYIPNDIDVSAFDRVFISSYQSSGASVYDYVKRCGGKVSATYESGNIYINIRDSKCKIYTKEEWFCR